MKAKILIVEDIPDMAKLLGVCLGSFGYDSIAACNGERAVQVAASQLPDLIIMDIKLPKMDGLKAVASIRSNPRTRRIPILAATGCAMPGDVEKCLKAGCDDYIAKPFTCGELVAHIKNILSV